MAFPLLPVLGIGLKLLYDAVKNKFSSKKEVVMPELIVEEGKKWYVSKTFWVNFLALVAFVVQGQVGYVVSPEIQGYVITGVNFLLRFVTKESIVW